MVLRPFLILKKNYMNELLLKRGIICLMMVVFNSVSNYASIFVETVTMKAGGILTLEMPADLQQYHGNGHSISTYHWTSSAPQTVKITSQKKYSCQLFVESNPIGNSAEITYTYDYWEGASLVTQTLCWNVKIERDSGGGGSGSSTENDKSNSITTPTENWCQSGNYNISWYNKNAKEFVISTNKELAGIAYLVNNNYTDFKGKTIKLNSDIDLSGKQWKTIGVNDNYFKGNFDGQGHTIFGIFIGKQDQDLI